MRVTHYQFTNSISGFKKFLKLLDPNTICVMEATGYYHSRLAYFLLEAGIGVCVVNPLKIKRYIQMNLSKIKTDKSDAKMIQQYAEDCTPKLWTGQSKNQQENLQITRMLSVYSKQSTQLKNKMHGEEVLGYPSKAVIKSISNMVKYVRTELGCISVARFC